MTIRESDSLARTSRRQEASRAAPLVPAGDRRASCLSLHLAPDSRPLCLWKPTCANKRGNARTHARTHAQIQSYFRCCKYKKQELRALPPPPPPPILDAATTTAARLCHHHRRHRYPLSPPPPPLPAFATTATATRRCHRRQLPRSDMCQIHLHALITKVRPACTSSSLSLSIHSLAQTFAKCSSVAT